MYRPDFNCTRTSEIDFSSLISNSSQLIPVFVHFKTVWNTLVDAKGVWPVVSVPLMNVLLIRHLFLSPLD